MIITGTVWWIPWAWPVRKGTGSIMPWRNVDLDIYQGECVGIIGTNGSGKSTILKIITGVLNETDGVVAVNGGFPRCWSWAPALTWSTTGLRTYI